MFLKKSGQNPDTAKIGKPPKDAIPSLISNDMNILGNLISDGYIDINGHIDGNIKCLSLTVRESGMVKGDVVADTVKIQGEISGLIKARHVHLTKTGRVRGVIMHESLTIDDGAFVDGQCKRVERITNNSNAKTDKNVFASPSPAPGAPAATQHTLGANSAPNTPPTLADTLKPAAKPSTSLDSQPKTQSASPELNESEAELIENFKLVKDPKPAEAASS